MNAKQVANYWQELAKDAGLDEAQTKSVAEVLGTDKVSATFAEKFMPVADHHRTLDQAKGELKTKFDEAQAKAQQYEKWYQEQATPALQQVNTIMQDYEKYKDLYGPLEEGAQGNPNGNPTGKLPDNVVTKSDLEAQLANERAQLNQNWSNLWEKGLDFSADYQELTGKRFPAADYRKFAQEHPEQSLEQSYAQFTAEAREQKSKAEREAWEKDKREEIERDVRSRYNVPAEDKPSESHPFFGPKDKELKDLDPQEVKDGARAAFTTSWGEAGGQ
jgi:multidrug efflux pump subunit AcrB